MERIHEEYIMKTGRQHGFTLVELLIVVSIIALLIGILLPALSEARRTARQVVDIANLREHGNGAQAYAAENKGVLPNTQPFYFRARDIGSSAPKLWPHWMFAGPFNTSKSPAGPSNGIGFSSPLTQGNVWKFYSAVFGDYIMDAEGVDLLWAEIFTSPGGGFRAEHTRLLREAKEYTGGTRNFLADSSRFNMTKDMTGSNLSTPYLFFDDSNFDIETWALSGNYRYTVSAIVGQSNLNLGNYAGTTFFGGARLNAQIKTTGAAQTPWEDGNTTWDPWRAFIKTSTFAFPTDKVLFWDMDVENSPTNFYTARNAKVAVNMVDGSTRTVRPHEQMPYKTDVEMARQIYGELVGTRVEYKNFATGDKALIEGGYRNVPAWFAMTELGPKGRDLGGGAYIGISQQ
jgi:prepilin-type N-terminal cleavage/methylation domain-containing protein